MTELLSLFTGFARPFSLECRNTKVHREAMQAGITVQFKTVLHSDWKFSPSEGQRAYIRFEAKTPGSSGLACVDMVPLGYICN